MAGDPARDPPDDVVGQGDSEQPAGARLRRAAVALVVALGVAAVLRSGLLSSGDAAPEPAPTASSSVSVGSSPHLVARVGNQLQVAGASADDSARTLPRTFGSEAELLPAQAGSDRPQPLIGVAAGGLLFRSDPARDRWRPLGRAGQVVASGFAPNRVFVHRGGHLVEVEIATGSTSDREPFPGFDPAHWSAVGLLALAEGETPLVMTHPVADGREDIALAWSKDSVRSLGRPSVQALGTYGPVVGLVADRVLTLRGCPGTDCRIVVVSRTNDLVLSRAVAPPVGWTFVDQPSAGQLHEALVTVEHLSAGAPDGRFALARLVPGGDSALLIGGTESVRLDAGMVDGPHGRVYLLADPEDGGDPQARVWDPDRPNVTSLITPRTTFPPEATLVCVCG